MKFLFIVQGEGRGHMTQAIAFSKMLHSQGHQLVAVIIGKSKRRTIPEFFIRQIPASVYPVESPNFETDKDEKKILIEKTILKNLGKSKVFFQSLQKIDRIVKDSNPDIILNFYDLMGGLYNFFYRPNTHFWVIGHQYLINHPEFIFAKSKAFAKQCFQINTWLTAIGADKKLALSFRKLSETNEVNLIVVPPLLRPEIKSLTTTQGDFYLTYMVNCGYADEVISFAGKNPQLKIKAYWDKKEAKETEKPLPNLSFHKVHDQRFLEDMAACKGLVCTAGFESVCEAMYLKKPVMVIPIKGQYEQACNAIETERTEAGITSKTFDFSRLELMIESNFGPKNDFKDWVNTWGAILQQILPETKTTESDFILTQSFS